MKKLLFLLLSLLHGLPSMACRCSGLPTLDSLSQLDKYDFIARVVITNPGLNMMGAAGKFQKFRIIEQFKGDTASKAFEPLGNSSCDLGIGKGEEWLLFGFLKDGELVINACDRNVRYRSANGERDWYFKRGIADLEIVRTLYKRNITVHKNGAETSFYPNGQKEIEENYLNNQLHGWRNIWHPNGQLHGRENYVHDTLEGKVEWFYASGQIKSEAWYKKGNKWNISRIYYDSTIEGPYKEPLLRIYKTADSLYADFKKVQVQYETIYNTDGTRATTREYYRSGKIKSEYIEKNNEHRVRIEYFNNGNINYIHNYLNNTPVGLLQEFNQDGSLKRTAEYDKDGRYKWMDWKAP